MPQPGFSSICVAGFLAVATPAFGDTTYMDVPRVTVQDAGAFRSAFEGARQGLVRVAIFGDSQETAPWGWGDRYMAHFNARMAKVYGPCGESEFFTCRTAVTPPMWLAAMQEATNVTPPHVAAAAMLPSVTTQSLLSGGKSWIGAAKFVFLHDASYCTDPALQGGPWFDQTGPYRAEILSVTREGGPGLRWSNAPVAENMPDGSAPIVQSGVIRQSAKDPPGSFVWYQLPQLAFGGKSHLQLMLQGDSAKSGTDVVGVRFFSTKARKGLLLQSFARGGMRLHHLMAEHAESGPLLRAMAPSVAVLQYGANDSGNLLSLEEWRVKLLNTINWLRTETGNPTLPVIIASDLRHRFVGDVQWYIQRMPVVAHELALVEPNVMAVNLPRICEEEYGWVTQPYLWDDVHYAQYSQPYIVEAFVGELLHALSIPDPTCGAANWADCVRAWGASCQPDGCKLVVDFEARQHVLPFAGPGTNCDDLDGDGYPDECPPGGPADLNRDGIVGALDIAILLGAWGTSDPIADIDADGTVGAMDAAFVLSNWTM